MLELLKLVKAKIKEEVAVTMPWREWYDERATDLGYLEADKASAVAVLHILHEGFSIPSECEEFSESDESDVDIFPYESEDGGRDGNGDDNGEEPEESIN